jgi:ribonuclease D
VNRPSRRAADSGSTEAAPPRSSSAAELADDVQLLETQEASDSFFAGIAGEPLLAVDTEAASFHRYRDRIYLIQLSTRSRTAIVDPLAVQDLADLGSMLADPAVEIVFHDADYDLRLLDRDYGFHATNLFDTRVAAQLLNEPGIGLAALLEKYLGLKLDKRFQRADWSARPLSAAMLAYAASDTRHLAELRDIMRARLEEMGRLAWAEEEFRLLEHVRWSTATDGEPGFLRMKGAKALRGRALAILREVYEWREDIARRSDKAAFRIMNNEPMLAIAKSPPADLEGLKAIAGVGGELVQRRGKSLLSAVERALEMPESKWPKIERSPRRQPDPAFEARLDRLKAARNREAERLDLAPGVACPNGTLEAIARAMPATLDELRALPEIRQWQVEAAGEALLAAAREPKTTKT